jgi:hypothetical protein
MGGMASLDNLAERSGKQSRAGGCASNGQLYKRKVHALKRVGLRGDTENNRIWRLKSLGQR